MHANLPEILRSIGPAASIVFAAWIFMGFLQQRFDAATERYRATVGQFRTGDISDTRRTNMRDEILVYKRRCLMMNRANMVGIVSAMLLILTLILGELDILLPDRPALAWSGAVTAMLGFAGVIAAAAIVLWESTIIRRQFTSEVLDVPELAADAGQEPGPIRQFRR